MATEYKPEPRSERILERAYLYVQSVPYGVTARWVFYRLLQDGVYATKKGYKHLLRLLSVARKRFFGSWTPWTLADDTRAAIVRGAGFGSFEEWVAALREQLRYRPDIWKRQPIYLELWFEAAAMQGQFLHYAPPFVPLLAFHGDVSIPEKWKAAQRLVDRWLELHKPVHVLYYGDLDAKGLEIPESAWDDIVAFCQVALMGRLKEEGVSSANWQGVWEEFYSRLYFQRVGLTEEQVEEFAVPENPERPGTWQWEALTDDQARELIGTGSGLVDQHAYEVTMAEAEAPTEKLRKHLGKLLE